MLLEFAVVPVGKGESLGSEVSKVLDIVDESGLTYKVGSMSTVVEGNWDELLELVKKCHNIVRAGGTRVVTTMKIDDRPLKETGRITEKIGSVEAHLGRELKK
ncbi:MAG: MTH1187 family thiamine-binding protein [Deltaproteobacteria bacterium]|nr:MTH1187 family thiamine-binding protein [Deltaproteobacteria bacterium]